MSVPLLFPEPNNPTQNLLPQDGCVQYFGSIYTPQEANEFLNALLHQIEWQHDEAIIFGKKIITKRKVAWYGEKPFEYTYSNISKRALAFNELLHTLKKKVENMSNETFNSCLLNLYHNGSEGMAWHSDGEKDLKKHGAIASLSFGAERKFSFKHKQSKQKLDIQLAHGSLLMMKDATQSFWLHRLPPSKKIHTPRVNLTFRTIME